MDDKASSIRTADTAGLSAEPAQTGAYPVGGDVPSQLDDQPTVISKRLPPPPVDVSESAKRILQGRILPGDRLGHFELVQYVGGGGMGRVFRAQDAKLARTVALKILPPEQAADRETLLRFQNEAQSAARLSHDNIVRVYYVGEDHDLHYIVFEFIEGVNVRELVESKGPLPLGEAISYTLQAADALAHAAARKVVHRDIKPSNLLITPEGQVKLIDMGLARLREADNAGGDLTASGVTLGTFDYISPEQARDPRCADMRSDVYSLGCTFFYMLAGQPPFPGGTVLQKLLQHQGDQPPDVRRFRPDLSEGVTRVLRRMLAKDPRHRYTDPEDLVGDLLLLAGEAGLAPLRPGGRAWVAPREPRLSWMQQHLPWILPLVALVTIVFALHFYWSRETDDTSPPPGDRPGVAEGQAVAARASGEGVLSRPAKRTEKSTSPPVIAEATGSSPPKTTKPAEKPDRDVRPGPNPGSTPDRLVAPPKPPEETAPVKPSVKRAGVLVVGPPAENESSFASLGAACRAAADGDVIELRYDGPRVEQPIKLENLRVTVRAAEGYRPFVLFHAAPEEARMWTVSGGRLTLIHVAVELRVPGESASDRWSLFEIRGNPMLRLERCSLSISCQAGKSATLRRADLAFFRVKAVEGGDASANKGPTAAEPATLELFDTFARGEAVLLRAEDSQPARLVWNNGLLLTSEQLLLASGGPRVASNGETLRIDLRHLTAIMYSGLCRLSGSPAAPYLPSVHINCADSILTGAAGSALIEQWTDQGPDDLRRWITWNGDRNIYDGFDVFWAIRRFDPEIPPESMTFEAWKSHWGPQRENLSRSEKVDWQRLPAAGQSLDRHSPSDYVLDAKDGNPALGTASDGRNLGCQMDRLAERPFESVSEKPAEEKTPTEKPGPEKPALPERILEKPKPDDSRLSPPLLQGPVPDSAGSGDPG